MYWKSNNMMLWWKVIQKLMFSKKGNSQGWPNHSLISMAIIEWISRMKQPQPFPLLCLSLTWFSYFSLCFSSFAGQFLILSSSKSNVHIFFTSLMCIFFLTNRVYTIVIYKFCVHKFVSQMLYAQFCFNKPFMHNLCFTNLECKYYVT